VDVKNRVVVDNGVNISLVSGEWPMFGQNPENTRASYGKAALTNATYWWTDLNDYNKKRNQTCGSPVVENGALYLPVINRDSGKGSLLKYSSIMVDSDEIGKENLQIQSFSAIANGKRIIGSPAVSDQYVIVATGNDNENALNYVYGFNKDDPSSDPWIFDYSNYTSGATQICYWGSPIIADGKVFITSWSGESTRPRFHVNNKVFALNLLTGQPIWNFTFPPSSRPLLSPTWSFSTPAYSDGKVIVGCMNNQSDNLFALEAENGSVLWNTSVGAIGKSSPVIYNNTVFIVCEQRILEGIRRKTKVTAVNLDDGSIRWETELGRTLTTLPNSDLTTCLAQSTPAIANGVLYVTSPDGLVTALDLSKNGSVLWTYPVYSNLLHPLAPILTSSPAYANGVVYVGTPDGYMYALSTSADDKKLWSRQAFPKDQSIPIVTNPVVTNGVVFFAAENSRLYALGSFSKSDEQINGSLTSSLIELPVGVWWKKFYASVKTNIDPSYNKITFSLLDGEKNLIKVLHNGDDILEPDKTLGRTLRLHAEFWAKNSTFNPKLLFWNISFIKDVYAPVIQLSSLTPNPHGWLNVIIPQFTVNVQDVGTGLLVDSAEYVLGYVANNQTYSNVFQAECTGVNGSTSVEQITMNLSKLDFFNNITALHNLRINITDLAGNTASVYVTFQQDTSKPSSHILALSLKPRYNATNTFIWLNATSFDNGTDASGVKYVELFYRDSTTANFSGDWIFFANSTVKAPSWQFGFTNRPSQSGGYFEVCTIATDIAENVEEFPTQGDASFLYDWKLPDFPSFSGDTLWFNEKPVFDVSFSDDFLLDTIQYRPNFETNTNTWTTIAADVNNSAYNKPWSLLSSYWDQMTEGVVYYLYFKINDTLGNVQLVTENSKAIIIRKDVSHPTVTINIPGSKTEAVVGDNFTVSAQANDSSGGSGVKDVLFYYRYSVEKSNWSSWTQYGTTMSSSPYEWAFNATHGDGYYELRMNVTDNAGNNAESAVFSIIVSSFPMTLSMILIGLAVTLLILCAIIYLKWRKRK
jgi:outer membrane protein assembly factor BamB